MIDHWGNDLRILFISSNRIGDAVLTTGLLSWLVDTYPHAQFTIACGPVTVDLFRAVPRLEKIIILKKQKRNKHWIDLWRQCVTTRWDIVVDLRNSIVTRLLWGKHKVYKLAHSTGRHKVEDHASLFKLTPPPIPHLWIDAKAQSAADKHVPTDRPIVALAPAANWPPKQWDIENFIALAKQLTAEGGLFAGARLIVVAAPHEREQVQPLLNAFDEKDVIDLIGEDLLTVAAALKKASFFVGNDSGLMHIAAAVNVPTVGLFGPSRENIYGPYGPHTLAIRTPESFEELVARQPYPGSNLPLLMGSLSVERVMQGVATLAQQISSRA